MDAEKSMTHTPGPWRVAGNTLNTRIESGDPGNLPGIAQCFYPGSDKGGFVTSEANARLISAAPDYFAACEGTDPDVDPLTWLSALLNDYAGNPPGIDNQAEDAALSACRALLDGLRAAHAKAKGGTR